MDEIDVQLHCNVCGADYSAEGVSPVVNAGLIQQWKDVHQHSVGELKMYHDAEVSVRNYAHSHKYGEFDERD